MKKEIDIHAFSKLLARTQDFVRLGGVSNCAKTNKPITKRNTDLILEYDKTQSLEGLKAPTRIADINRLLEASRVLGKDFDKASKSDIKNMIAIVAVVKSPIYGRLWLKPRDSRSPPRRLAEGAGVHSLWSKTRDKISTQRVDLVVIGEMWLSW